MRRRTPLFRGAGPQPAVQVGGDALGGVSIPQFGDAPTLAAAGQDLGHAVADGLQVGADHRIGALLDGDRPFGVLAQRQARHAERGGLFLQAAGIGQHQRGAAHQADHLQVTLRRQHGHVFGPQQCAEAEALDVVARARVHREDQRQLRRHFGQHLEQRAQGGRIVDVRRPVQRDDAVAGRARQQCRVEPVRGQRGGPRACVFAAGQQRIDHHIADEGDACSVHAFALQVGRRAALGRIQPVGDLVGEHAVDLFRHPPVIAAQPGLDVHDRHALLHRHQRAGERRIDVADDDDAARPVLVQRRLEAFHHLGGLHRMAAGADLEVQVGLRQLEVGEQAVAHARVVVLAGMHQQRRQRRLVRGQRTQDRRDLHEIGPRADDAHHGPGRHGGGDGHEFRSPGFFTASTSFCSMASV